MSPLEKDGHTMPCVVGGRGMCVSVYWAPLGKARTGLRYMNFTMSCGKVREAPSENRVTMSRIGPYSNSQN